ncbi:hypothetical protein [Evtepia sp.]|nr:hypothetical protein [Candidatus Evtepia faecavium]
MAKNRKWGPVLAFGAVTAVLGGIAAYKHRKEIERTLQEIADQMDAWDSSEDFFHDEDAVVHTVTHAEKDEAAAQEDQAAAEGEAAEESDFVDAPGDAEPAQEAQEEKPEV